MRLVPTELPGVVVVEPVVHRDARGFFVETWSRAAMAPTGIGPDFVQDNLAGSARGVLRGLHLQVGKPQGKLVRAVVGDVFDVAVDVRRDSATYGRWVGVVLRAEDRRSLWVPPGFAHGYYVLSDWAEVAYKVTDGWYPQGERVLRWDDPDVGVRWPIPPDEAPILSDRDAAGLSLAALDAS